MIILQNFEEIIASVNSEKGYYIGAICEQDLSLLQTLVGDQYQKIMENNTELTHDQIPVLKDYHSVSESLDHSKIWQKKNRILNLEDFNKFKKTEFYSSIKRNFDDFYISDEEEVGHPELYFRIVRPAPNIDIGPLHADSWFWELGHGKMPKGKSLRRIKFWFSLLNDSNETGFRYVSGSHKRKFQYSSELRHGFEKPVFQENQYQLNISKLIGPPGSFIAFNDNLLHGGYITQNITRVSCEFTLIV